MTPAQAEYVAAWQALQKVDHPAVRRFFAAAAARTDELKASKPVTGTGGRTLRSGFLWPFGAKKGTPIEECKTKDLQWLLEKTEEDIEDASKSRWVEKNIALRDGLAAELATR